jgi:hypothetical protein
MTYPELRATMLRGLEDDIYIKSISGLIDCYEAKGLTTDAAIDELAKVLKTKDNIIKDADNIVNNIVNKI